MAKEIEYEQFEQTGLAAALDGEVDLRRISGIPMELSVEIGRTQMTVGETLSLRAGSIVPLDRFAGEPVDLLVNGTPLARGEVVVVDDKFGLRVSQILQDGDLHGGASATNLASDGTTAAIPQIDYNSPSAAKDDLALAGELQAEGAGAADGSLQPGDGVPLGAVED